LKWPSLEAKIGKMKKSKFGRIDSRGISILHLKLKTMLSSELLGFGSENGVSVSSVFVHSNKKMFQLVID